jgi:hypothetical protein
MSRLSFAASAAILAALPFMASAGKASAGTGAAIDTLSAEGTPSLQQVGYGVWREGGLGVAFWLLLGCRPAAAR